MIATKPGAAGRWSGSSGPGGQRSSATCGAVRLNTTNPSTKIATAIPIGASTATWWAEI